MADHQARRTKQARSAAQQEAMTRAAATLLIEEGPDAITFRNVARAAGVAEGSASYYFPSKRALYAAAVRAAETVRTTSARATAESLEVAERSPADTAGLMIEVFYAPALGPDVVTRRLEPMLDATRSPELHDVMAASRPHLLESLRIVLRRSGHATVADSEDVELVAQQIDAGLLYGALAGEQDPVGFARRGVARVLELASRPGPA
ncbi:TetR family transcriptional regulator [Aeromicrobium sp. IC_218]|uniref:TetR/AcrR family transcriptional regulator n=1 Tax=Aeromicrobium sp. IC_218 TaxID=2545468 RepID=UPI001038B437|nr:TetR family transcriptional regulator [Aeromicrobium sp. IC_218]TCI99097.1 TetR/AcrR family transcriptional regulator [Aeromicrobium sp. IC_218]